MKYFVGAITLLTVVLFQFAGCRKNMVEPNWSNSDFFTSVVAGGDAETSQLATGDFDAMNDGAMYSVAMKPLPPSIQSVMTGNPITPTAWGSYIETTTRTISQTTNQADTVSIADAMITLTGHFVVVGTVNGVVDTVRKPFTETFERRFRFVRIANNANARHNWRLDGVSILNGKTDNAAISLTQVQVIGPDQTTFTVTDPNNYYMQITHGWMHQLPLWKEGQSVTVTATIHSTDADSDIVYLHHLQPMHSSAAHRVQMLKVSETPDGNGGFNRLYSVTLTIPAAGRHYGHVVVAAVTSESFYSADSTKFSGAIWGVPYKTAE